MGKWGEEKEINGVTILPHVVTDPFKKIEPNDIIDYLQPISTFLTEHREPHLFQIEDALFEKEKCGNFRKWEIKFRNIEAISITGITSIIQVMQQH